MRGKHCLPSFSADSLVSAVVVDGADCVLVVVVVVVVTVVWAPVVVMVGVAVVVVPVIVRLSRSSVM